MRSIKVVLFLLAFLLIESGAGTVLATISDSTLGHLDLPPAVSLGSSCDGIMLYVKFTPGYYYNGNLGGVAGANAICAASFPGYHFCDWNSEVWPKGLSGCLAPASGFLTSSYTAGWINSSQGCNYWTWSSPISYYGYLFTLNDPAALGNWTFGSTTTRCDTTHPLACCK